MITDKELEILKKSLIFIKDFPKTMNISSGDEYLKIHNRNIETLKKLAQERKSGYILKKIADYEAVSNVEIDEFVKWKRKDVSLVAFATGRFIGWLINLLKTKGNTGSQIEQKLIRISEINENLLKVVENPGLEELMNLQ